MLKFPRKEISTHNAKYEHDFAPPYLNGNQHWNCTLQTLCTENSGNKNNYMYSSPFLADCFGTALIHAL